MAAWKARRGLRRGRRGGSLGVLALAGACIAGCGSRPLQPAGDPTGGTSGTTGTGGRGGATVGGEGMGGTGGEGIGGTGGATLGVLGGTSGSGAGGAGPGGSGGVRTGPVVVYADGVAPCDHDFTCNGVPPCPDGRLVVQRMCFCPECVCERSSCPALNCPDGQLPILRPGYCCPTCSPPGLDSCKTDGDCALATSLVACCSCPGAISKSRGYYDRCSGLAGARPNMNSDCSGFCAAVTCGQCPAPPTGVVCAAGTCTATYAGGH